MPLVSCDSSDGNGVPCKYSYFISNFLQAAAAVTVDDFALEIDIPIPGLESVQPWLPKLNVGGDVDIVVSDNQTNTANTLALQVGITQISKKVFFMLHPMRHH